MQGKKQRHLLRSYKASSGRPWIVTDSAPSNNISGHFSNHDYDREPSVLEVLKERARLNEDELDKQLFDKLEKESKKCQESQVTNIPNEKNSQP